MEEGGDGFPALLGPDVLDDLLEGALDALGRRSPDDFDSRRILELDRTEGVRPKEADGFVPEETDFEAHNVGLAERDEPDVGEGDVPGCGVNIDLDDLLSGRKRQVVVDEGLGDEGVGGAPDLDDQLVVVVGERQVGGDLELAVEVVPVEATMFRVSSGRVVQVLSASSENT